MIDEYRNKGYGVHVHEEIFKIMYTEAMYMVISGLSSQFAYGIRTKRLGCWSMELANHTQNVQCTLTVPVRAE